ncbi:MAG: hypothetical protein ACR2QF_00350 [Geminicoccaceae bacterium]
MIGFPSRRRTEEERHLIARRIGRQAYQLPADTHQPLKAVLWLEKREARLTGQADMAKPVPKRRA